MRFCDKLPKLRKNNNFSQEQLADKLGVSRQAVSKWEMGSSYPDMDKMLQICKILNCNLEDVMDDGVIGENPTNPKTNKFNFNMYMKDFLDFVTKSYNMFCSMKLKQKIKCIFEMACISIVLILIGLILYQILNAFIYNMIGYMTMGYYIASLIGNIFSVILGVVGLIIALHLFKIRYLDYFITIEDQNVVEKTIEEPIEKKEDRYYQEKPKEKIIIRDTKHSTFRFFDVLGKIILFMLKTFAIMCVLPIIALFVFLIGCMIIGLYHMQYGILFFWIVVLFIGLSLLTYVAIEWIYNFVAAKKQQVKKIFIIIITGLVLIGAGTALSICTYLNYDRPDDFGEGDYATETITIPVNDKTIFNYDNYGFEYKIDNAVEDIQIEVKKVGNINYITRSKFYGYGYEEYYLSYDFDFLNTYKLLLNDLKNKKIRNYDTATYTIITVTMSQKTYDKLRDNYNKREEEIEQENRRLDPFIINELFY